MGHFNHNHNHCAHDLHYCEHCDSVYCTKCDREWSGHYHFTYTTPYIWYYYGTPYTITYASGNNWSSGGNYTITTSRGEKVTDTNIISAYNLEAQTGKMSSACTHN